MEDFELKMPKKPNETSNANKRANNKVDEKTIQNRYRKYNNFMVIFSLFISITVIFSLLIMFEYKVFRPQDRYTEDHFSEKTAIVSFELANLLICEKDEYKELEMLSRMDERLKKQGILMFLIDSSNNVVYSSSAIDKDMMIKDFVYVKEVLRERYIIETHILSDSGDKVYFCIPKTDNSLIKKNFLTFITAIFIIGALFRWGLSSNIMKRVYRNMVEPLEKLKKATNEIQNGNLDFKLKISNNYNKDLRDTFRDFEKMRETLKENKKAEEIYENNRKELISNISHDLKTPISSIMGYVEGILDGVANTPAKRDRYMQIIYQKSLDMNRLINDLILFSKLDVNKVVFDYEKTILLEYMEVLFEEYGMELRENQIELVSRFQVPDSTVLHIDRKQLRRVFNNIIGNAMKHLNKEIKAVEIMVYEENDQIVIRISDNGEGIKPDKVENIFNRFYKADESRNSDFGSSGLGLSISKQIVTAHGGFIWATSEYKKGTTVYFTLSKEDREANYAKNINN